MNQGPCSTWPIDPSLVCCSGWADDPADWTPEQQVAAEIATDTLFSLTAGRFGLCEVSVRPCTARCIEGGRWDAWMRPVLMDGAWFNSACGCGPQDCSCTALCTVVLPGPVHRMVRVMWDGHEVPEAVDAAVPRSGWRLLHRAGRSELVALGECWPACQDLTVADDAPGAFTVTYLQGIPVPAAGVRAVSALACEIGRQCAGQKCRLPERVRTVTREGVSYDMFDPGEWLTTGLTGLADVDGWIRQVNPHGLTQPPAVFSLDLPDQPEPTVQGIPAPRSRW